VTIHCPASVALRRAGAWLAVAALLSPFGACSGGSVVLQTAAPLVTTGTVNTARSTARPIGTVRAVPAPLSPTPTPGGPVLLPLSSGEATCLWIGTLLDCHNLQGTTACTRIGTLLDCHGPDGTSTCSQAGTQYLCTGSPGAFKPILPLVTFTPIATFDWCGEARAAYANPGSIWYQDASHVSIWCL
jgi:hypothetical protein